jgi:hypothetical protein
MSFTNVSQERDTQRCKDEKKERKTMENIEGDMEGYRMGQA